MVIRNPIITLVLCMLISVSFTTAQASEGTKVFALPEENGAIILAENASYADFGVQYENGNYAEGRIYLWYIPMLTTGDGWVNLHVSPHDCNVTIKSISTEIIPIGQYLDNRTYSLECSIVGDGIARIDVMQFNESNLGVYIDGVLRQEGNGWNSTGFGVSIDGPAASVVMYSSSVNYEPPRNAPHYETFSFFLAFLLGATIAVLAIFIVIIYRRKKQAPVNFKLGLVFN